MSTSSANGTDHSFLIFTAVVVAMCMGALQWSEARTAARLERIEAAVGPCAESFHTDRVGMDAPITCHPLATVRADGDGIRCVCP